ncbi:MAG: formylglycine-generating enzyme family protein [Pirellulaceae bacterium]
MKGRDASVTTLLLIALWQFVFASDELAIPAEGTSQPATEDLKVAMVRAASMQKKTSERLHRSVQVSNGIGMRMRLIPPCEFLMGSGHTPQDIVRVFRAFEKDALRFSNEHPQHWVRITMSFYLGVTEVTQSQWVAVMGTHPWRDNDNVMVGPDYPAVCVTWEDAIEFCRKLSVREGATYRLPSEAEWEHACRATTSTMYGFGNGPTDLCDSSWWGGASGDGNCADEEYAHQVGLKRPNCFGLYDMHGNVWEWCQDRYDEDFYRDSPKDDPMGPTSGKERVIRGGGWEAPARFHRSACRHFASHRFRGSAVGFRVAREID